MKYLVAPKQLVSAPLLEAIPDVQKLRDPVGPDVIGVLLGLIPLKRRPKKKETHYDAAAVTAGDIQMRSGCLRSDKCGRPTQGREWIRTRYSVQSGPDDKLHLRFLAGLTQLWCKSSQSARSAGI